MKGTSLITFCRRWWIEALRKALAVACGFLLLAGLTACDPGADITWVNETDQEVGIYLGDDLHDFDTSVPPRSSKTVGTIEAVWEDVVVIRDKQKRVLFRQEITWDELKAQGFRFVITEDMLSPTPTEGQ
jgi:hypothetical protein